MCKRTEPRCREPGHGSAMGKETVSQSPDDGACVKRDEAWEMVPGVRKRMIGRSEQT
jgi:hypothetical protein